MVGQNIVGGADDDLASGDSDALWCSEACTAEDDVFARPAVAVRNPHKGSLSNRWHANTATSEKAAAAAVIARSASSLRCVHRDQA